MPLTLQLISRKLNLDEGDSFEDEKWKCAKFLLHVTEEHHLTHDGVTNLSNSVQWLVDSLFSQVKERMSAHLSDTQEKHYLRCVNLVIFFRD